MNDFRRSELYYLNLLADIAIAKKILKDVRNAKNKR